MKLIILSLIFLVSCSHEARLKRLSNEELAEAVMRESLLSNAVNVSGAAAPNSLSPIEGNIPKGVYQKLTEIIGKNFEYQDMYNSVQRRILAGAPKEQLLALVKDLEGPVWTKYLKGLEKLNAEKQSPEFEKIWKQIDQGDFDFSSNRAKLIASITDHNFTVNFVKISNDQVLRLVSNGAKGATFTEKQKSVLEWIGSELSNFNAAHIKTLFSTNWIALQGLSEKELDELLEIRRNDVMKLGKTALEQELVSRYHRFFEQMQALKDAGKGNRTSSPTR